MSRIVDQSSCDGSIRISASLLRSNSRRHLSGLKSEADNTKKIDRFINTRIVTIYYKTVQLFWIVVKFVCFVIQIFILGMPSQLAATWFQSQQPFFCSEKLQSFIQKQSSKMDQLFGTLRNGCLNSGFRFPANQVSSACAIGVFGNQVSFKRGTSCVLSSIFQFSSNSFFQNEHCLLSSNTLNENFLVLNQ